MRASRAISRIALAGFAAVVMTATPVKAALVYDYTGNPFTGIQNPNEGTSLDASVTFNNSITDNYTGEVTVNEVLSASFSTTDSTFSYTTNNPLEADFTFVDGKISQWYLSSYLSPSGFGNVATLGPGSFAEFDDVDTALENYNNNNPGTWVLATPLPGSFLLFGSALACLVTFGMARSRFTG